MSQTTQINHCHPIPLTGSLRVPIYQTCTFRYKAPVLNNKNKTKHNSSGMSVLEDVIAKLGDVATGIAFGNSQSAINAILKLLKKDDEIIAVNHLFGHTHLPGYRSGIKIHYTDTTNVAKAITSKTKLIWVETTAKPTLKVSEIQAIITLLQPLTIGLALIMLDQPYNRLFHWDLII